MDHLTIKALRAQYLHMSHSFLKYEKIKDTIKNIPYKDSIRDTPIRNRFDG